MTRASAALLAAAAIAVGWYGRSWFQAEDDRRGAAQKAAAAARAAWRARKVVAIAGSVLFALGWVWLHQHGHGSR